MDRQRLLADKQQRLRLKEIIKNRKELRKKDEADILRLADTSRLWLADSKYKEVKELLERKIAALQRELATLVIQETVPFLLSMGEIRGQIIAFEAVLGMGQDMVDAASKLKEAVL